MEDNEQVEAESDAGVTCQLLARESSKRRLQRSRAVCGEYAHCLIMFFVEEYSLYVNY